jgi:large subunit ribosomal protein L5
MSRYKKKYREEVRPELQKQFGYANPMQVPTLKKIVISMGVAEALKDKNVMQDAEKELTLIAGQRPIRTKSRKSIAGFKLREDQEIGLKVTLRRERMFDFFDRFTNIVAPRIRDFRGFPKKGDGRGAYTLGLRDQQSFPEINLDDVKRDQGMHITFVTSATSEEECIALLTMLGMPFAKGEK